ncbi:MAG TPA: GNAT family protein [Thermoleophilaceae bacterium]|nr:GNAT family protein [Thermoleophilaceae bacterium]
MDSYHTRPTGLADPGALLATTHRTDGGLLVRPRLTRPSDTPRLRAFLEALSPEARRLRFFSSMPVVPDTTVRHFTFFDPRKRLVVAATAMDAGREEIVGLADVAHLDSGLAELGVVVDDRRQRVGLGKLLTEVIVSLAAQQGATQLRAELLEGNQAMLALMRRLGPTTSSMEGSVVVVHTRLPTARRRRAA